MEDLLDKILSSRRFHGRFGRVVSFPPREARTEEIPGLPGGLKRYLDDKGISNLFQHQRKMFDIVSAGNNAVISTPTASGKTLSFNLPVISRLLEKEGATAMYVYPLKALSNDQLSVLKEIDSFCSGRLLPAIYDGDTPQGKRPGIRENSRIILTNPYELHHVLPYHYKWERFLRGLEFMVIDEAHKYTGVFGSNTAFLMMRLKRILDYYGARPRFILSSASIGNPLEFARSLIGEDFESVEEDSSPSPGRFMIPIRGGDEERSALPDIRDLMIILAGLGLQTICFTGSRKLSELLPAMIREKQSGLNVVSYRAGYLPAERREIEDGIRKREVMAVVSTPALELGIDIGGLDAVVTAGFPRSLSSLFQQAGRCGRRGRAGLVFYIAFEDVIDRYFFDHPELIENPVFEDCAISTENEHIASGHILCAASELPIRESKERSGIASHAGLIADFVESGLLGRTEDGVIFTGTGRPHEAVSLDGTGSGGIALLCEGKLIETMTREQAWREAYDGAVLLHQGVRHIVTRRDIGNSIIEVERRDVDFYTDMMKEEKITGFDGRVSRGSGATSLVFGSVSVVENAIARRMKRYDMVVGMSDLDMPALTLNTAGFCIKLPIAWGSEVTDRGRHFMGSLHALEHALIGIAPVVAMCSRWDLGGISSAYFPELGSPAIFIYDGYEGGVGLSEKLYEKFDELIAITSDIIGRCPCENGCPSCVLSPKCGSGNQPMDKQGASLIASMILQNP